MKLKKYVKLKEDMQEESMSEREQELYNSLMERVSQNAAENTAKKKKLSLWKILTPALTFAAAIAVTLTCVFTLRPEKEFLYSEELKANKNISFAEMQEEISYLDVSYVENNIDQVTKYYDSVSNVALYYSLLIELNPTSIELVVVVNENYDYKFELKDFTTKQLSDYTLNYASESSRGDPQINYKGWIKVQTETVYFDYVQIPALGDEAFFESIQQIIKVKK